MRKWNVLILSLCLASAMTVNASALEYSITAPGDPEYRQRESRADGSAFPLEKRKEYGTANF